MHVDIQARSFTLTEALRYAVESDARQFADQFPDCINSVNVRLFDVNGTRGGIDKGCLVFARVGRGQSTVVASVIDADLYRAIAKAFTRLTRGTRHSLNRNRRLRRPRRLPQIAAVSAGA